MNQSSNTNKTAVKKHCGFKFRFIALFIFKLHKIEINLIEMQLKILFFLLAERLEN